MVGPPNPGLVVPTAGGESSELRACPLPTLQPLCRPALPKPEALTGSIPDASP